MLFLLRKVHWKTHFRSTRGEAVCSFPSGMWKRGRKDAERKKPKTQLAGSMTSSWKRDLGVTVSSSVSNIFFLNELSLFFLHDKFQRPPPSHSSLSPYTAALFHVCYILLSHVVFSYPVLFALPPTFHVYLNVSCPHATQSGCMKKRKDLPWSPSGVPLELGLWSWFGSERMGNA